MHHTGLFLLPCTYTQPPNTELPIGLFLQQPLKQKQGYSAHHSRVAQTFSLNTILQCTENMQNDTETKTGPLIGGPPVETVTLARIANSNFKLAQTILHRHYLTSYTYTFYFNKNIWDFKLI